MDISLNIMKSVLNDSINGVIIFDLEFQIVFANKEAHQILESTDDLVGKLFSDFVSKEKLQTMEEKDSHKFHKIQYGDRMIIISILSIKDGEMLQGFAGIFQDISTYEAIVEEIDQYKKLNHRLEAIISSSYDGIYLTDGNAKTILVNHAYERITGISRENVVGRYMDDLVKEGFFSQSGSLKSIETGKQETLRQRLVSGKEILITSTPVSNDEGGIEYIVTNVRDITDLVELRRKLSETRALNDKYRSELENAKTQSADVPKLIVKDKNMMQVVETVIRVAKVDTTVLLMGETGAGKGQITKLIHENSLRKEKRLIQVNCGAIPHSLIESELFGYAPGAFTGALKGGKMGVFELANHSTLFLDEISELNLDMQVKLLKVLEDKVVMPIGGQKPIPINVRIIAACNQDLKEMIQKGLFREDLYYRLNIIPITIPPLRRRRDDIIPLCLTFLKECNEKYGMRKYFSTIALNQLIDYSWPGNVRELRNLVEQLVIIATKDEITKQDLPSHILGNIQSKKLQSGLEGDYEGMSLKDATEIFQKKLILHAIKERGSQRKAAELLGVDPATITRKLNSHKVH